MIENIPSVPGIYLLHLVVKKDIQLDIGKLGEKSFPKGDYFYVGSAQGGLQGRISNHLKRRKKNFWHIDYLLADENVEIKGICWKEGAEKGDECKVAFFLWYFGDGIKDFGSSDCKCESHLYRLSNELVIEKIKGLFSYCLLL
jgi:Uri superfamily endonuclease